MGVNPRLTANADVGPACDTHHNRMDAMNTLRNIGVAVAAVAAMVVVAAGTAGSDPTPAPGPGRAGPGYQIPGSSGPVLPGGKPIR
jgi:anti-sigma-K factor RskA